MRILVTGGAGFVGSHLCERLLREGNEVLCVDSLLSGSKENIAHLGGPRFAFAEHDITEPFSIAGLIDRIYNLACPASPVMYQRVPLQTLLASTLGVDRMLRLARAKGARFLQASTSEIYGDPLETPQRETYWGHVNPNGPRSCYDEGKRAAESFVMNHHLVHGVDTRIVRIFNTYGPRMQADDGRAVSNFLVQALRGEPLTVHGDGSQTRSLMYIDDLIGGLITVMESAARDPVNLGNPQEISMRDLAAEIIDLTGSPSTIISLPRPQDDPSRRVPDITYARSLGWEPRVSRHEGLMLTMAYFMGVQALARPRAEAI